MSDLFWGTCQSPQIRYLQYSEWESLGFSCKHSGELDSEDNWGFWYLVYIFLLNLPVFNVVPLQPLYAPVSIIVFCPFLRKAIPLKVRWKGGSKSFLNNLFKTIFQPALLFLSSPLAILSEYQFLSLLGSSKASIGLSFLCSLWGKLTHSLVVLQVSSSLWSCYLKFQSPFQLPILNLSNITYTTFTL